MDRYGEALKRAKELYNNPNSSSIGKGYLYTVFPELKESEDEITRKALIKYFSWNSNQLLNEHSNREVIAWLEKQGDKKPADKVEPKFKVGDIIIHKENGAISKVNKVLPYDYELISFETGNTNVIDQLVICDNSRLWTIQDAKDGDVLSASGFHSNCTFIFDKLDNWKFDGEGERAVATGHCCITLTASSIEFGVQGPDCVDVATVKPATIIQKNLLFQKMKDAGYEWDAEKKELKKVEKKSAEWSEEDENNVFMIESYLHELDAYRRDDARVRPKERGAYNEHANKVILPWLKSLRPQKQWKPTERQLKELEIVAKDNHLNPTLQVLLEQLKKL